MIHRQFIAVLVVALSFVSSVRAEDIQTDPQTGTQYRVTGRQVYQRPVSETHIEQRPYTVYTEHVSTEYQPSYRNVYSPVTEYSWEPYLANRWNPFSQPTVAYRYVPHTRWDMRTEESQIPITRRDMVPEQRVASVPVVTQRMENVEHITRVAVAGGAGDPFSSTATASRTNIGSTGQLTSDPPKSWQPNDTQKFLK
jgi:hypothetical protein